MKSTAKVLFFAAASLWAAAAQALLLTTWRLPSNLEALEAERAASTNEVEVLNAQWSDGGDSMTFLYRESRGGPVLAKSFDERALLEKFGLVKSGGGGAARRMVEVSANDDAAQSEYLPEDVDSWMGRNGGSGFTEWETFSADATFVKTDFRDADPNVGDNDGDFTLHVSGGEAIVGRYLTDGGGEKAALESGEFAVRGWVISEAEDAFLGFAVYDSSLNELLRWGMGVDDTGIYGVVFRESGGGYELLERDGTDGYIDYRLTWEYLNGGLQFTLYGTMPGLDGQDVPAEWSGRQISVDAASVGAIAVIASTRTGATEAMAFDKLSVTGTGYAAVPEPGTLGLLAAGAAMLAARRRRGKGAGSDDG